MMMLCGGYIYAADLILFNYTPYAIDGEVHLSGDGCPKNFGFRLEGHVPAQDPEEDRSPSVRFYIPDKCSPVKVRSSIVGVPAGARPIKPKGQHAKEWPADSGDSWSAGKQKIITLREAPEAVPYNTEWVVAGR